MGPKPEEHRLWYRLVFSWLFDIRGNNGNAKKSDYSKLVMESNSSGVNFPF